MRTRKSWPASDTFESLIQPVLPFGRTGSITCAQRPEIDLTRKTSGAPSRLGFESVV